MLFSIVWYQGGVDCPPLIHGFAIVGAGNVKNPATHGLYTAMQVLASCVLKVAMQLCFSCIAVSGSLWHVVRVLLS